MLIPKSVQHAMIFIQQANKAERVHVYDISVSHMMNHQFLGYVCRKMKAAGIFTSQQGPGGGYTLIKKDVTLLDLMQLLSEPTKKGIANDPEVTETITRAMASIRILK